MALELTKELNSPLVQRRGAELIKINPETVATQVVMAGGDTVEDALSALKVTVETFLTGEADSNGVIDRLKELVAAIEANKDSVDALLLDKVAKADIVNDLTTGGADKVLSAEQGKALKALIDGIHVFANQDDLDRLTVVDGQVAVDGTVMRTVMYVDALPETMPTDLAEGGLLIVGA